MQKVERLLSYTDTIFMGRIVAPEDHSAESAQELKDSGTKNSSPEASSETGPAEPYVHKSQSVNQLFVISIINRCISMVSNRTAFQSMVLAMLSSLVLVSCSSSTNTSATTLPTKGTAVVVIDGKTCPNAICQVVTDTFSTSPLQTYQSLAILGAYSTSDSINMVIINIPSAASGTFPLSASELGLAIYNSGGVKTDSVTGFVFRGNTSSVSAYSINKNGSNVQKLASNSLSFNAPFAYYKSIDDTVPTSTSQISVTATY